AGAATAGGGAGAAPAPPITLGGAPTMTAGFDMITPPVGCRARCGGAVPGFAAPGRAAAGPGGVTERGTAGCPGGAMPGKRCGCGGPGTVGARGPGVGGRARTTLLGGAGAAGEACARAGGDGAMEAPVSRRRCCA